MDYFDDDPGTLPAGYVPDYSVKMKQLTKKQVDNITDSMVNAYSGYRNKRKYDISKIVVQLQQLTTFDADRSTRLESENGQVLDITNQVARANNFKKERNQCMCRTMVAEITTWLIPRLWLYIRVNLCLFLQQENHMG